MIESEKNCFYNLPLEKKSMHLDDFEWIDSL